MLQKRKCSHCSRPEASGAAPPGVVTFGTFGPNGGEHGPGRSDRHVSHKDVADRPSSNKKTRLYRKMSASGESAREDVCYALPPAPGALGKCVLSTRWTSTTAAPTNLIIRCCLGRRQLNRSSPIDSKKIQGECSGFLRQEFRELELLDNITTQQYHESFHHHVSCEYMPPRLESVLAWSNVDALDSADASDFAWTKKLITHFPILKCPPPEHPLSKVSNSLDKQSKRMFTPMKLVEKRKGRISDTFNAKQEGTQNCAYDATMFVLFNMWNANHAGLASDVEAIGNEWLQLVMRSFRTFKDGLYTLEEVRDHTRRKLHRDFLTVFVYGHEMSAEAVMLKMMTSPMYIDITSAMLLAAEDSACQWCTSVAYKKYTYEIVPPILAALVTFSCAPVDEQIQLTVKSNIVHYNLAGVVYYGDTHYTARTRYRHADAMALTLLVTKLYWFSSNHLIVLAKFSFNSACIRNFVLLCPSYNHHARAGE
ncbi:hypothetical protein ARMGADRAFT_1032115 [Armillaria gallica]|uniref:Uncharacterized protein n=1 Tax=Armillaria gallica TaxID=47427 RepID=A0A2H3DHU7_ARMGA|nr:hypothetical protein ARMGADRAFT_1032115 [Armillaria gallica]